MINKANTHFPELRNACVYCVIFNRISLVPSVCMRYKTNPPLQKRHGERDRFDVFVKKSMRFQKQVGTTWWNRAHVLSYLSDND